MTVINRDAEEAMNLIHWNIFYLSANALRLMTAIGFVLYANLYLGLLMILVVPRRYIHDARIHRGNEETDGCAAQPVRQADELVRRNAVRPS
jgi:hypothetical protein